MIGVPGAGGGGVPVLFRLRRRVRAVSHPVEVIMRAILAIATVATAMFLTGPATAVPYQGPWCAVQSVGHDTAVWDCRMRTFEECRLEVVAGNRGHCTQNPNWPGWYGNAAVDAPVRRRRAR
jgi:hypothetical protein